MCATTPSSNSALEADNILSGFLWRKLTIRREWIINQDHLPNTRQHKDLDFVITGLKDHSVMIL